MKIISKEEFDKIPDDYKGVCEGMDIPEWKGRRTAFLPGCGTTLFIEGVHFLVVEDYSHLPVLHKENARVGDCYQFSGDAGQHFLSKVTMVLKIYRLTDEQAKAEGLVYLDRVSTTNGDYVLPGSDIRSDLIKKGVS